MPEHISSRFDVMCRNYPDRTAILDGRGEPVTFERLYYSVHSLAQAMMDRGVQKNNVVAFRVSDIGTRLALSLAAIRIGAIVALFDHAMPKPGEKSFVNFYVVDSLTAATPTSSVVLTLDPSWLRPADRPVPQRGTGGIIGSTSGTTGTPKYQALSEAVLLARMDVSTRAIGPPDAPVLLGFNPGTSVGFRGALTGLLFAQQQVWQDRDPHRTLRAMSEIVVRYARLPPYSIRRLLDGARTFSGPLPKLDQILVGGSMMAVALAQEAEAVFGCKVFTGYGSTESGSVSFFRLTDAPDKPGTVGRIARPFKYRFIDDAGAESDVGELHLLVPKELRASAYFNAPGPYDQDGWLATGDIGYIGADGNLILTGRRSEFINAGGTKRAPEYFEERLSRLGGVNSVAAFAVGNDWGSEDAGIAIVGTRDAVREEDVRDALSDAAGRGFVFRVFFVDDLPVSEAGKVNRKQLSERLGARNADLIVK